MNDLYGQIVKSIDDKSTRLELHNLAKVNLHSVKINVAKNINTAPITLIKLANDTLDSIRLSACKHINLPVMQLVIMSGDSSEDIRMSVASNLRTPLGILASLSCDASELVRQCVLQNPSYKKSEITAFNVQVRFSPETFLTTKKQRKVAF